MILKEAWGEIPYARREAGLGPAADQGGPPYEAAQIPVRLGGVWRRGGFPSGLAGKPLPGHALTQNCEALTSDRHFVAEGFSALLSR